MNACMMVGRWGKDLRGLASSRGGAKRASLVLQVRKRSLLSVFDAS